MCADRAVPAGRRRRAGRGRAWPRRRTAARARPAARPATAWPPPAGCWSRCPARPRSTGCPGWPPGSSTPGTPRSPSSPTRTPWSAVTACRPASSAVPALLTGALSAIVVRQGAPLSVPDARADERVADLPAVTSGQVQAYLGSPLVAASGHVVGVLAVYDPEPRDWTDDETQLLRQLAVSVVAELELSAARSAVGHVGHPAERRPRGQLHRHLGTGPADRAIDMDERCAALYGLDGRHPLRPVDDMQARFVHRDDRPPSARPCSRRWRSTASSRSEFRAMRSDGAVRWMVSPRAGDQRPARRAGAPPGHRHRRHRRAAAGRRSGCRPCSAPPRSPRSPPSSRTPPSMESSPEIVLRGAEVLGAEASAMAVFDAGNGPLRLHMTSGSPTRSQGLVDYPVRGLEIDLDDTQATQYAAMHGRRVLLADREEALARFPSMREGLEVLNFRAAGRAPAARRGPDPRLVRGRSGTTDHPFSDRRRRGARGARRPDRAQRLAAAGRRRAATRSPRWREAQPAAAGARRGRPGRSPAPSRSTCRSSSWRSSSSQSSGLVLDPGHRRAAAACTRSARRTAIRRATPSSRATCAGWWRR